MDLSNLSDEELENMLATIEGRAQQITGIGQRRLEDMSDSELESRLAALESQPSAAEAQPQEPEPALRERMGIIDRVANQRIAQTGREDEFDGALGKANAIVHGLTPFTSHLHNARRKDQERADWAFVNLENWNEGIKKFKNEIDPKHQGKAEKTKLGADGKEVGVLDVLTDGDMARDVGRDLAGVAENTPLGVGHLVKWIRDKHREKNETTLYDYLLNRANDTSLKSREIDEIDRQANGDPGKFQNLMRRALYAQMQHREQVKKDAAQREKDDPSRWYEDIVTGTINNVGYTGEYIIGGALGGVGAIALPAAFSQPEREAALRTPEFDVDADGNLIRTSDGNSAGMALAKSTVGAVAEAAVERYLEKMLGVAYKGAKRIPGVGKVVGGIGDAVGGAAEGIEKALAAKLVKNPVGKFIVDAAKNFAKYSDKTGVQGLPMEMLEEHVQDFVDTVVGLDEQEAPLSEMGARARDFWHNKFLSKERNVDLLLGLVGTMAIQGAYAGTKEHARLAAMRHDQAGALKMLLDPKLVDGMSNDEVNHVFNLIAGDNFTRENVEEMLKQVDATSKEAVALTELKDLNNKDWSISSEEYDGAKSQFVPPTRETRPGVRELDYRPFTLKNGTTVMRAYDPNTGISIDRYSKTKFVVTNADGLRATVGGANESEAGQNALKMADKFSIIAQVENAKLPRKMDYIQKRVEELGGRDKFVVVPNMKTLLAEAPYLANDVDFNPDNPAVRLGDGRVVLVANNMRNAYEVNSKILHESGIHEGLRKEFTPEEKMAILKSMENEPRIRRYRERIDAQRLAAGKPAINWSDPRYLEEQFAMVWDRRRADPRTSQKVEAWMRNLARKAGLPVGMNTADVEVLLSELQDKMRRGDGSVQMMDDAGMQNAFPNTEGGIDYGLEYEALDLADPNAPSGATEGGIEVRKMARADRIKAHYPNLYAQGMENFGGDEDAAIEWISGILADEGRRGKLGEREEGIHGYRVAQKLENGEDLLPEDMDVLEENGFVGRILYTDFGYRRQKNGVWKRLAKPGEALPQSVAAPKAAPKPTVPVTAVPVTVKKSNRQIKAEHEKKFVDRLATKGGYIQRIPASAIKTGDGRIVQFKEDADPRTGIVPGNELEGEYDETTAGLPVVMRFEDGHYETVTGRHRINLAQRNGIDINVMVLEHGEDGKPGTFSVADAEAIDAKANIKDGKGTIKDYIKFFRHAKMTKAEAEKEGLLGKKTQGRKAFALYNDATPELTAAVDFDGTAENDDRTITPEQAGIIAMNAPKDGHKLNGAVQRSMRDYCVKHPKANGDRLARLTQAKAHQLIQAEKDGQLKENGDGQMFLFADMAADVAATDKLDEIENYKEKRNAEYRKVANQLRDAKNSKGRLQISPEFAQELDLIDTETGDVTTDKKRLEAAAQEALGKAFMWTRMELPADMQDELEKALKLGKYADQQDLPVQNEPAGDLNLSRPKPKPTEKPKPAPVKKPTQQQTIDAFSAATGIPVTMIGANGEVTADSHAAAETALGRPGIVQNAQNPTENTPDKPQNGLSGVDLGDIGAEFDNLGNDMWFSRELEDGHTEEEIQAHNLAIGVKMVKLFASKGYTRFEDFAKTFAARIPEAYKRSRDYIPGMWLTARIMGTTGIEEITEKGALEVLKAVDQALSAPTIAGSAANSSPTASVEPTQATTPPAHGTRGEAISAAADEVVALIDKGEKFDRKDLEAIVGRHLGGSVAEGTFSMKNATDILELAVNRKLRQLDSLVSPAANVDAAAAVRAIQRIRQILAVIPTQTTRSATQDKLQQFSTPPHEAFTAAWVANVKPGDVSLEPSAGIGGIAVFSKIAGADVIVNELDTEGRAPILEQLGLSPKVYNFNAENLWTHFYPLIGKGEVKRPTVVVMNPPFSNSATTHVKDTIGIGGKHIEEALQMLAPGGRLVAIVGHGMAHNSDSPKVRNWWKRIGDKYCVRADVTVNGNEYAKYGTTYDNNLIVIDKVAPDNTKTPVFGKIESIDELPAMLEGVRNDRPDAKQPQNAKPLPVKQGGNGGSAVNGAKPANGASGNPGARVGEGSGGAGGLGRPNAGLGRPKPAPHAGSGKPADEGNGRGSGVAASGSGGRADNVDHGQGGSAGSVRSPDATVIDAGGVKGEVNTDVREVGNGTFSEYRPSKVRVPGAKPHPTALVESTAMASVLPPDPTYSPILPKSAVENGQPSEAQIEQIVYAGQAHSQLLPNGDRRSYFMGDGTGLGKGTEISGVICDNFNHGRTKAVWVSKSSNLFSDAQRDLKTFGLEKEVFEFDPRKKESTGRGRGIAFMSYSALANKVAFGSNDEVLSTDKKKPNRFQELVRWLGKDFDGVIVFDECHKAGNAVATKGKRGVKKPSNAGRAVVALQNALPKARILYVSATGATEVSNLSYATRLGLWGQGTAFRDRDAFIEQVSSGGLSVMEIVARDMKSMGVYMARSLSYEGIVNRKIEHQLSEDQRRKYDEFADAWQLVSDNVKETLVSTGGAGNSKAVSAVMSAFWGGQQRFFNQMLTAMQMPSIIADAKKQLDEGNSVVFQLVNTNEATQERAIQEQKARGEEVNPEELDLSPRDILIGFVEHSFPTTKYIQVENEEGDLEWRPMTDAEGNPMDDPLALEAKQELLDRLRMMKLDNNPLEMILDEFGSENVAEITGRSRRREQVRNADGEMETVMKRRSPKTREAEIDEFNAGKRKVLVFSDAGGTGKSFHADRRFANTTKRVHYLVQAGWRADSALQGFGRTHRSNEMQPPEYVLCSTNIKGHQRFISTVARRLAQLGSLTAGDRSSAGSGVFSEEDNLENQYADGAVKQLFHNLFHDDRGRFNIVCKNLGFLKVKLDRKEGSKEVNSLLDENGVLDPSKIPDVPTFLNRILNCRVSVQNQLFDDFSELMHDAIEKAKDEGKYDPGLEKLQGDKIEETSRTQLWNDGKGTGSTDIVEVGVSKKTKRVDFETALARIRAKSDGRDYFFAINRTSGNVYAFAETHNTKTDAAGRITTKLMCLAPDGKLKSDATTANVRTEGENPNFDRLLDTEAPAVWNAAIGKIPDMDVTKRYFVHGTLLPIWDRLGARDPRIFRIAPTGGNSSFLGLEIKADQVNDVLRRFGKSAQAVELTPEMVINRIVKDGKRVPLLKDGWGLKRARVNGDYRIELEGVEDVKTLQKLEQDGLGTIERIAYVPRFFIPRTEDGVSRFLTAYPAVPEDGGINNVSGSGNNYMALTPTERQAKFAELLESYKDVYNGVRQGEIVEAADALKDLIAAMPTEEIFNQVEDFQQYDDHKQTNPIHHMRMMLKRELKSRGALTDKLEANYALWYSRELEDDDTSSVAIHEVNAWRRARGLPEMKKHRPTSVAAIVRAGKTMASNRDEMERFIEVSARTPQNWTATEVNAVAQRRIQLEEDYDEKTRLINEAEMNGNREEAQRIREARDLTQDMLDTMDRAINKAKREWGLAGLARRFMLNRNGSFVRFSGELQSFAGRKLTEEEETGARMLWDAYREAQGKLDEETVRKTSELLKDIVRRHMATEEQQHRIGHGKTLKQIEDEYAYALDHIRVHANRAGGVLLGLPDGRKWIDALRRYHMAAALETGRKLTVDEMLAAIHADIDGMIRADDHDIMQIITGHGNTYEADNSELEKAMREQRALMNEYQKWEDMMTEGHLPDKTGLIRDEPTQTLRDAQKITRDLMREFMEQHPELMQMDASKRLKTVQDSLMKRWRNEIEDLQKAIDDGEKIMRAKNVMTYTPEMQELRRQLEEKRREYHEMFPPEPLTHEEKVSRALRVLQRKLAALQEKKAALENATTDAERENILRKSRGAKLEDESLEAVRDQIADLQEDIQDLHDLHFPAGTVDEFMAMVRRRKNALAKNIQRIETQLNNRDFAPQKREPSALAKRVAADPAVMEAVKLRNAASQRLMQERERFRRSVLPYNAGRALDWFDALTSAPRVFRTMLDLSATMTQGAALFTSHPVLGWQALVDSVKSFYSADNTDKIMAALYADPDYTEFQEMGGRVYNVSNLDEKTLPEEFRGISQKVFTIRGKQYGIDDIPGVKASERSFGVFLNALNLGVYKAIKASGGWGPTGPTDTQKKDIAISLNVASGYGYDNKGGRGAWDRVMSAALWAPRFAASGFKMAVGWNILAPQWTGLTTERSYRDRMVSSKVAAQQYVRQVASMAAWTLLATLLMGRKDPEWLEEMLNPLSSNFLNVRVGNTNLNFFGPIKQWWTFMARMLTGKTIGRDGVVKNADQLQVAGRFARGKLSPLAGVAMDILDGKTFIGEKLVWDRSAEGAKEKNGWKHVAASVGVPLSAGDLAEAFKENTLANALLLTPFVVAGAGKSTIAPEGDDAYNRKVNPYKALAKEYKAAMKAGDRGAVTQLRVDNPILNSYPIIESRLKAVQLTKKQLRDLEKSGRTPSESLLKRYDLEQKAVLDAIERAKK